MGHFLSDSYQLIVIGGGPAGMAAAYSAVRNGLRKVLVVERDRGLGGILNQCIHTGFGLEYYREDLTGPEYAGRFIRLLSGTPIEVLTDTMTLEVAVGRLHGSDNDSGSDSDNDSGNAKNAGYSIHVTGKKTGYAVLTAQSVVLATGCRERARGAIGIPGTRPAGVITAGTAQRYVNIEGYMPGNRIIVLGSGDVGLIMARRMTLEGAKVLACVEIMPRSAGLMRNIVQCLHDYGIPLLLSHTITDIRGKKRVERVTVCEVDGQQRPKRGTEKHYDCDTVLLSVGLIPENELADAAGIGIDGRHVRTSAPGVFICGNALHVHDIVDNVTVEAMEAGATAAKYVKEAGWETRC